MGRAIAMLPTAVAVLAVTVIAGCTAKDTAPRGDPCLPGPSRPDVTAVTDARLAELYCTAARSVSLDISYLMDQRPTPSDQLSWSAADVDYVVAKAAQAVDTADWPAYRCCLFTARTGMQRDPQWVPIYQKALTSPRREKVALDHGYALNETLRMLGQANSAEAAALLVQASQAAFWGAPFAGQVLGAGTKDTLVHLRSVAVSALGLMDAEISLPILQTMADQYPNKQPVAKPSSEYEFEDGAGYQIQKLINEINAR